MKAVLFLFLHVVIGCKGELKNDDVDRSKITKPDTEKSKKPSFVWEGSNIYFLLTDRFKNGDTTNDNVLGRTKKTDQLKGFEGGDIKGIIKKIKDGYFKDLGVNVIWFSPIVEQIHGSVDEGTGNTYAFHGYWTKDWTKIDPNFGTYQELKELVETAHENDIRILMDIVMNHTGPVTEQDPVWPNSWVRTSPQCTYKDYESTVNCTLLKNLPDIKTENNENVELPETLVNKWKSEGRLEIELAEIDVFFTKTRLKRSPKNYIIKWLTDYVRELGIDGYRVDTVKHIKEDTWNTLAEQARLAFAEWKSKNQDKILDNNEFFMLGELYDYRIDEKRFYDFGDRRVDYFARGFDNMINFQFKHDANQLDYEKLFSKYNKALHTSLIGKGITNYISSYDDNKPFDKNRSKTYESATKLLLTPGISQIYYGDEIARPLVIEETDENVALKSNMDWDAINNKETKALLDHWQKLGKFRKNHPAVGAGKHKMISQKPYVFSRKYHKNGISDKVVIGLDFPIGEKIININSVFPEGTILIDQYSGKEVKVFNNSVMVDSKHEIALLAIKR
jgi:alpha-amylase